MNTNVRTMVIFERDTNKTGLPFIFIIGNKGYEKEFKDSPGKKLPDSILHIHAVNHKKRGLIRSSECKYMIV